ncbi:dynein, cytoplasmic 1, intermediate chain 2a [Gadus macrocephalus]|uniref:dynein, cytoplasmic 1, intermediate chain 2a n=1 Tax=Gadus macrocephalus TaxID=80720 RepID=UPI0028CB2680|nr:dynein, cytoplasmic 1, intermediate chain 2a [Gadus macrocephalus]
MSDKSELKAELERKKRKLAQIREEKRIKEEERKKEADLKKDAAPQTDDTELDKKRREADAILQSMGITSDVTAGRFPVEARSVTHCNKSHVEYQ